MKYAALFRGINVGGKNIVKMTDLTKVFNGLGFQNIRTYIQSGNVVFDADPEPGLVKQKIQTAFEAAFGFESLVTLRTQNELVAVMNELPFSRQEIGEALAANPDVEHLYVYLLDSEAPGHEEIAQLEARYNGPDKLRAGNREIYLLCHNSIRDSKLAVSLSKLNMPMTARNWKTVGKLCELMNKN